MKIGDIEIELIADPTERAVEVPLGCWFLDRFPTAIEIGAVMTYHGRFARHVFDLYDPCPGCIREDARILEYLDLDVLSISTLEHVGWRTKMYSAVAEGDVPTAAPSLLRRIAREAAHYLITFPIGWHPTLDLMVRNSALPRIIIRRTGQTPTGSVCPPPPWVVHDDPRDFSFEYPGAPRCALAICVVTNCREITGQKGTDTNGKCLSPSVCPHRSKGET